MRGSVGIGCISRARIHGVGGNRYTRAAFQGVPAIQRVQSI